MQCCTTLTVLPIFPMGNEYCLCWLSMFLFVEQRINSLFHYLCSQCYAAQHSFTCFFLVDFCCSSALIRKIQLVELLNSVIDLLSCFCVAKVIHWVIISHRAHPSPDVKHLQTVPTHFDETSLFCQIDPVKHFY